LHQLLQNTNEGRWPIIGLDLGNKLVTDFSNNIIDAKEITSPHLQPISHPEQEGLQDDKPDTTELSHTIPEYILPAQHRPTHHRPDHIRAVGYTFGPNGKLIKDPTYKGRRQLQLIECKYSTDGKIQETINNVYTIYEPLKQAIQLYGTLQADIKIIPIVISRT
jgi:hypothetical protein